MHRLSRSSVGRGGHPDLWPIVLGVALIAMLLPMVASSQPEASEAGSAGKSTLPRWEIGLGAAALHLPDYRGAEQSHGYVFPVPFFVYSGDWLRVDRGGVRAELFDSDRVELNVSVGASVPVRVKRNEARRGMPAIDPVLELGPSLNVTLARWGTGRHDLQLRLPVRAAFVIDDAAPDYLGGVFTPNLRASWRLGAYGQGFTVRAATGPSFASGDMHRYYYDVDQAFATSARPSYRASGGYSAWESSLSAVHLAGRWRSYVFGSVDLIDGAAYEDSPLVKRRASASVGIGVAYMFFSSGQAGVRDD